MNAREKGSHFVANAGLTSEVLQAIMPTKNKVVWILEMLTAIRLPEGIKKSLLEASDDMALTHIIHRISDYFNMENDYARYNEFHSRLQSMSSKLSAEEYKRQLIAILSRLQ